MSNDSRPRHSSTRPTAPRASSVHEVLVKLRRGHHDLSRNRNFEFFEQLPARRALRVHLMLRQLERDLLSHATQAMISLRPAPHEQIMLELYNPLLRLRRRVFLTREELALLRERPEVDQLLPRAVSEEENPPARTLATLTEATSGPGKKA